MAKKVKIDVEVKGKGTKKVAVDAKNAGDALDKTSKSAGTADRNIKGVAAASSGASKNFSKMAQGMTGGIVPAYAALAANIFAIGAAFRFLKGQADLANLQDSQVQFAATTGIALTSMTARLREASGGMLGFKEAGQATAIGLAQGFSGSQMEKLTEGARKVSIALGRDFEDSFDRLVRGASKAEPELLDELGIVLRLKTATENYAASIGKQVDALTAAERSQAVLIETQKQLDEKYGEVAAKENPFTVLKTTFDDLVMKITQFFLPALEAMATFIASNAKAAMVVFGLLAYSILAAMVPIDSWGAKMKAWGDGHKKEVGDAMSDIKKYVGEMKTAKTALAELKAGASLKVQKGATKALDAGVPGSQALRAAAKGSMTKAQEKQLKKQIEGAEKQMKKFGKVTRGTFKGIGKAALKDIGKNMDIVGRKGLGAGRTIKNTFGVAFRGVKIGLKGVKVASSTVFRGMAAGARMVGKAMGAMMKGAVIFAVLQQIYNMFIKISEAPYTVVTNVINMISNMVKPFEWLFNLIGRKTYEMRNNIQKMINSIIEKIPAWLLGEERKASMKFEVDEGWTDLDMSGAVKDFATGIAENVLGPLEDLKALEEEMQRENFWEERLHSIGEYGQGIKEQLQIINDGIDIHTKNINLITDSADREERGLTSEEEASVRRIASQRTLQMYQGIQSIQMKEGMAEQLAGLEGSQREAAIQNMLAGFGDEINRLSPAMLEALKAGDVESAEAIQESARSYVAERASLIEQLNDFATKIKGDHFDKTAWLTELLKSRDAAAGIAGTDEVDTDVFDILDSKFEAYGGAQAYHEQLTGIREASLELAVAQNDVAIAMQNTQFLPPGLKARQMEILNIEKQRLTIAQLRQKIEEDKHAMVGMGEFAPERARAQAALDTDIAALKVAENGLELAKKAGTDSQKILNTVGSSIESNLISNIKKVIDGTKSMKEGFADMAVAVLKNISDIIVKLLVMKALEATGMSMFAPAPVPGAKMGGVFSEGKKTYAGGGVARGPRSGYPATLHGTEAVVPLPGGRAIPVNMTGGANNIVVNVSGDGGMQTQGGDQEGLGRAIANAVQTELQNQKRSGGILNPYGVA